MSGVSVNPSGKRGKPRLPATELERIFLTRGITREMLCEVLGYTPNYVNGVLRGRVICSPRFIGEAVINWPSLAQDLAEYGRRATR